MQMFSFPLLLHPIPSYNRDKMTSGMLGIAARLSEKLNKSSSGRGHRVPQAALLGELEELFL